MANRIKQADIDELARYFDEIAEVVERNEWKIGEKLVAMNADADDLEEIGARLGKSVKRLKVYMNRCLTKDIPKSWRIAGTPGGVYDELLRVKEYVRRKPIFDQLKADAEATSSTITVANAKAAVDEFFRSIRPPSTPVDKKTPRRVKFAENGPEYIIDAPDERGFSRITVKTPKGYVESTVKVSTIDPGEVTFIFQIG